MLICTLSPKTEHTMIYEERYRKAETMKEYGDVAEGEFQYLFPESIFVNRHGYDFLYGYRKIEVKSYKQSNHCNSVGISPIQYYSCEFVAIYLFDEDRFLFLNVNAYRENWHSKPYHDYKHLYIEECEYHSMSLEEFKDECSFGTLESFF